MSDEHIMRGATMATPGARAADSEEIVDQLLRRVQTLEEEKRRWKWIGIGAILLLVLALAAGIIATIGAGVLYYQKERRERVLVEGLHNQQAAELARLQALQAQAEMERAKLEAERADLEARKKAMENGK